MGTRLPVRYASYLFISLEGNRLSPELSMKKADFDCLLFIVRFLYAFAICHGNGVQLFFHLIFRKSSFSLPHRAKAAEARRLQEEENARIEAEAEAAAIYQIAELDTKLQVCLYARD